MSVKKGQLVGEKNGMFGKKHSDSARKKMSEKVLKAYAEGRIPEMTAECRALGVMAAKRVQAKHPELWQNKLISYFIWLFDNTFISEPSFVDTFNSLEDALDMEHTEPQAKYWVALLQIDFDKVQQNLADGKVAKAVGSIFHFINPLVPDTANSCYTSQYGYDKYSSEAVNNLATDYCLWMIENRNKLENYLVQLYALNGRHKDQMLEILKRRFRNNWGDQKSEKYVKVETDNADSGNISITFTDA